MMQRKELQEQILAKHRVVNTKMGELQTRMDKRETNLGNLQEVNKYFYRLNSSTPYMIAQAQYLKGQMEKKGVDTQNAVQVAQELIKMGQNPEKRIIRDITGKMPEEIKNPDNYCNPEMISKFVERLKQKENKNSNFNSQKMQNMGGDGVRKVRPQQFKSVLALCATYNKEFNLLAISLIDKEIKLYRIK